MSRFGAQRSYGGFVGSNVPGFLPASTLGTDDAKWDPRMRLCAFLCFVVGFSACAQNINLPGTNVPDTPENRSVLETVETYRTRLVERQLDGLLQLASKNYFEDSGTPQADDDYGYEGLRQILKTRLSRLKSIRYQIQYRSVKVQGNKADVEVLIDGSFELTADAGDQYRRISDFHRFKLEKNNQKKWKFLSGM